MCSLHHAAPEIAFAVQRHQRTDVADPKVDIWALGVVAFCLLTGTRVFAPSDNQSAVFPYLLGHKMFPWEDPAVRGPLLKRLGNLRRTVLACLSRDPEARPTSTEVLRGWTGMFEGETHTKTGLLEGSEGPPPAFAAGASGASNSAGAARVGAYVASPQSGGPPSGAAPQTGGRRASGDQRQQMAHTISGASTSGAWPRSAFPLNSDVPATGFAQGARAYGSTPPASYRDSTPPQSTGHTPSATPPLAPSSFAEIDQTSVFEDGRGSVPGLGGGGMRAAGSASVHYASVRSGSAGSHDVTRTATNTSVGGTAGITITSERSRTQTSMQSLDAKSSAP